MYIYQGNSKELKVFSREALVEKDILMNVKGVFPNNDPNTWG